VVNAEKELLQFRTVTATVSECVDVFDEEIVRRAFQEQKEGLLTLTGYLGEFLGGFHRSWLVVFSGAYKRGKTWWLLDMYINAAMSNLNVVMFSLEMTQDNLMERILHRVTGCADEASVQRIPVVDCLLNQKGECFHEDYRGTGVPILIEGETLADEPVDAYTVCTACRDSGNLELFQPVVGYERHEYLAMTEKLAVDKARALSEQYSNRCKLKTYPRFAANIADIKRDLTVLETTQNFIPDVIIIDYADILKPESGNATGVQKEDETWIALSQLAGERKALVLTATQLTKEGQDANTVSVQHTARWSGKLGHVDAIYGINQTPKEKDKGIQRINTILHRHQPFSETEQCVVLQNLDIGAIHLDSFPYQPENTNNGD
jgi:replicative DNA helicase